MGERGEGIRGAIWKNRWLRLRRSRILRLGRESKGRVVGVRKGKKVRQEAQEPLAEKAEGLGLGIWGREIKTRGTSSKESSWEEESGGVE